jgi:hypothetical protein
MLNLLKFLLCVCVCVSMNADARAASCKPLPADQEVEFDFNEAPLRDIARWVSCVREMNLMFQTSEIGQQRVTWISSGPIKVRSLKKRFRAMLSSNGLRMEKNGAYYVIARRPPRTMDTPNHLSECFPFPIRTSRRMEVRECRTYRVIFVASG